MWNWLFGKQEKEPTQLQQAPTSKKAAPKVNHNLHNLQDTIATIDQRQSVLEKRIQEETAIAIKLRNEGKKSAALIHLKKKKSYEEQISKLITQSNNLQIMIDSIEQATLTTEYLDAQKAGAAAMKAQNERMNADKIADEMSDIQETLDDFQAAQEAISQPLMDDMEDDELMEELAQMEADDLAKELEKAQVGSEKLPKKQKEPEKLMDEEDELDALTAELNAA